MDRCNFLKDSHGCDRSASRTVRVDGEGRKRIGMPFAVRNNGDRQCRLMGGYIGEDATGDLFSAGYARLYSHKAQTFEESPEAPSLNRHEPRRPRLCERCSSRIARHNRATDCQIELRSRGPARVGFGSSGGLRPRGLVRSQRPGPD